MRISGFRSAPRRLFALGLCAASLTAAAQQPTPAQANALRQACRFDYIRHCTGVPTGVSGTTNQNANAYSRWCSSQISGPNQPVNTRSEMTAPGAASGAGARQSSTGGATGQQLDQDRFARTEGGQRFGQYGEMRGGGFGAGRFAGGGFGGVRGRR